MFRGAATPQTHGRGTILSPTEGPQKLTIRTAWCKSCGICIAVCPKHSLELVEGFPVLACPSSCNQCGICEQHCPDWAILVHKRKGRAQSEEETAHA